MAMADPATPQRLRLLSYNIQSGLTTRKYSQYLTRSWKHLVPVPSRMANLDGIARVLKGYDIVALQEVDAGSLVIQADERVPHGKVVRVMDEAKAAGIANIAVAVAPK